MAANTELPIDIIFQILVRLPAKTLCRLRCISKPWSSLISSPYFQQHHLHHSQQNPLFLRARTNLETISQTLYLHLSTYNKEGTLLTTFSTPAADLALWIHSCHGLVCILSMEDILVFNPSTKDIITLPEPLPHINFFEDAYAFGFGYVASTKEFKVVRFFQPPVDNVHPNGSYCNVFTLGTGGWKVAKRSPYTVCHRAPFLRGALHLSPIPGIHVDYIATFDIESEDYKQIRLPKSLVSTLTRRIFLKELGGSLSLTFEDTVHESKLELWLLKDYINGEWVRYTIDLSIISSHVKFASPLAILGDGRMLLRIVVEVDERRTIFLYCCST